MLGLSFLSFNIIATTPTIPAKELVDAATDKIADAATPADKDVVPTEEKTAPKKPIPPAVQLATYTTNEKILASMLPKTEVVWLDSDSGKFLALQRDYLAAEQRGVAIFVSELSTPVNYNVDIEPIRTTIDQYGWTSIAINPPNLSLLYKTKKNDNKPKMVNGENDTETNKSAMEETTKSDDGDVYADALVERILSAQEWADRHAKTNILIIQGRQVAYLANALIKQHLNPFQAIIMVDADHAMSSRNPTEYPANIDQLSIMLSKIKTPILDVYHEKNDRVKAQMLKRKRLNIKEGQKNYRQHLKVSYSDEEQLSKVIYGWLKTLNKKPKT